MKPTFVLPFAGMILLEACAVFTSASQALYTLHGSNLFLSRT
jgi:hypothetical protein